MRGFFNVHKKILSGGFAGNSRFTVISQLRAGKTQSKRPRSHCMTYIFGKLWHSAINWPIRKSFQCILQSVRFLLANHSQCSGTSETFSNLHSLRSIPGKWFTRLNYPQELAKRSPTVPERSKTESGQTAVKYLPTVVQQSCYQRPDIKDKQPLWFNTSLNLCIPAVVKPLRNLNLRSKN